MKIFMYLLFSVLFTSCVNVKKDVAIVIDNDYFGPIYLLEEEKKFNNFKLEKNGIIFFKENPNRYNIKYKISHGGNAIIAKGAWKNENGEWEAEILGANNEKINYKLSNQNEVLKKFKKNKILFSFDDCTGKIINKNKEIGCIFFYVSDVNSFLDKKIPIFLYEDLRGNFDSLDLLSDKLNVATTMKKLYYNKSVDNNDVKILILKWKDDFYKPSNNDEVLFFKKKLNLDYKK